MCDRAMGGVLFIDEAYTLCGDNDMYGQEAIDALTKRMEADKGKFVVILSGTKDRMTEFLSLNAGLSGHFMYHLHIDDYNEEELVEIFKQMASKEQYILSPEAEMKLQGIVCAKIMNKSVSFGNAREMSNLLEATIQQLSVRVSQIPLSQVTRETYQMIMPEDIVEL